MIPINFFLVLLADGLKRYPENFKKLGPGPVVCISKMFRSPLPSPLPSIKTQLSMSNHVVTLVARSTHLHVAIS